MEGSSDVLWRVRRVKQGEWHPKKKKKKNKKTNPELLRVDFIVSPHLGCNVAVFIFFYEPFNIHIVHQHFSGGNCALKGLMWCEPGPKEDQGVER
jgi:hypothetical protein